MYIYGIRNLRNNIKLKKTIPSNNIKADVTAVVEVSIQKLIDKGATLTKDEDGSEILDLTKIK